jgi:hypothetical protein
MALKHSPMHVFLSARDESLAAYLESGDASAWRDFLFQTPPSDPIAAQAEAIKKHKAEHPEETIARGYMIRCMLRDKNVADLTRISEIMFNESALSSDSEDEERTLVENKRRYLHGLGKDRLVEMLMLSERDQTEAIRAGMERK